MSSFLRARLFVYLIFEPPRPRFPLRSNAIGVEEDCAPAYLAHPLAHAAVRINDGAELRVLDQLQQYTAAILVRHAYGKLPRMSAFETYRD